MKKNRYENSVLSEAARKARNEYKRNWVKNNPEKVKAATVRYWERKAQAAKPEEG